MAAVIQDRGRYLVCLRPRSKRHGGLWEFPGGKLHQGESLEDAVARELHEELALSVQSTGSVLFEAHDPGSTFHISFLEVISIGHPHPVEHDEVRWSSLIDLATMPLAPTDSRFVAFLLSVAR